MADLKLGIEVMEKGSGLAGLDKLHDQLQDMKSAMRDIRRLESGFKHVSSMMQQQVQKNTNMLNMSVRTSGVNIQDLQKKYEGTGGTTGATIGQFAGTAIGAVLGSVIPGAGTFGGSVVGSMIGGSIGSSVGGLLDTDIVPTSAYINESDVRDLMKNRLQPRDLSKRLAGRARETGWMWDWKALVPFATSEMERRNIEDETVAGQAKAGKFATEEDIRMTLLEDMDDPDRYYHVSNKGVMSLSNQMKMMMRN